MRIKLLIGNHFLFRIQNILVLFHASKTISFSSIFLLKCAGLKYIAAILCEKVLQHNCFHFFSFINDSTGCLSPPDKNVCHCCLALKNKHHYFHEFAWINRENTHVPKLIIRYVFGDCCNERAQLQDALSINISILNAEFTIICIFPFVILLLAEKKTIAISCVSPANSTNCDKWDIFVLLS